MLIISDRVCSCNFVGKADELVTYKECYLLNHLHQIPKELWMWHFACSIWMAMDEVSISAADTLPRFLKLIYGRFSKTISAKDLEKILDALHKQILRAAFDLYATVNPLAKQQTMSVHDFALTLISCFDPEKLPPLLEHVQTLSTSIIGLGKLFLQKSGL
ncbi:unnamed protein product [Peronospora farinosa]|uniref:Uncharacterized protein n=1 Tax=Peronospora farinosa TaxID=134698 RepID=A0ABN8BWL4_9STRA|nr:unnamed protein product [Peronospora farinosa]